MPIRPMLSNTAQQLQRRAGVQPGGGCCQALENTHVTRVTPRSMNRRDRASGIVTLAAMRVFSRYERKKTASSLEAALMSTLQSTDPAAPAPPRAAQHVSLLCADLDRSLAFFQGTLGLQVNNDRPHHKLPYRGAWLWIGAEMLHLLELPAVAPAPALAARHLSIGVAEVQPLVERLLAAGVPFKESTSGRLAIAFKDPDNNSLEVIEAAL